MEIRRGWKMWVQKKKNKPITFPRLNGLNPTLESCTWKVFEEVGELFQLLGKGQGLSGEQTDTDHAEWVYKTISEALDGAQSLCTLIHVLAKENNVDIQGEVFRHEEKLRKKGYLV